MPRKYIPKGGNGGKREGAGRKNGSVNRASKLAIRQALLTGRLPHMLLLEWAQTGIMEQVAVTRVAQLNPAVVIDGKVVEGPSFNRWINVPKVDADGNYIREPVALSETMRVNCAVACQRMFAAQLSDKPVETRRPEQNEAQMNADAKAFNDKMLTDLPSSVAGVKPKWTN